MPAHFHPAALAAALATIVVPLPAIAGELPPVVVTATRTPTRSNDLLSDVSIIDREQLDRSSANSLPEFLATLPGIQTTSNGGVGASSTISLRGTNTNQTLVLIDGQRMSSATTGAAALEHLSLDQVERIEVLRGPASSLYGSDAIGGVIQIFTRQGEGAPKPSFSLGAGTYRTRQGTVAYGGQSGDTRFNLQAGWQESDSFSSIREAKGGLYDMYNPDEDRYRNGNLSARFSHRLNEDLSFGGEALHIDAKKRFDSANCDDFGTVCTANYDNRQHQQLSTYSAHLAYRVTQAWKTQLRVGQSQDKTLNWRYDPTALAAVTRQHYDTTQDQLVWQNDFALSPANKLMAALEWRQVRVSSTQAFTYTDQSTRSMVLGYQGNFGAHSLQASVRSDDIQRLGRHNNGSLAYGYHFDDAWTARLGVGTAFHAPTFNDLYWPLDMVNFFQGNPDLKPERSRNKEAGISYQHANTSASLTVYHNKVRDLLDYVSGVAPSWIGTYGNLNSATLQGASFSYARRSGDWEYRGNLDWLSAKDDETGNTLQRRARQTGTIELRRQLGQFNLGTQLQGVSSRYNNRANTQKLDGYGLLNLDANYRIDRDWSLFAKLNNLLDKEYTLVRSTLSPYNDYETPGRNLFVGVRYSPK
ncbi:MAG: vitamin transporter [Pseudomonadota bacterium]|nr:vitamin transporter [Pseudomonadota bacterium]MDQ5906873.1 vitamin transporter [Pseudomonadota bacterium]